MNIEELRNAAATCELCSLYKGRNKPVFDKGNSKAAIMICGMVPADEENAIGMPFVGRAGKLLDTIIKDAGLTIEDVYITNLVKCYLAAGLPLHSDWIDACLPYLLLQIDAIKPKVIITLGKDASCSLLSIDNKVSLGKVVINNPYLHSGAKVFATYHPSYLLRGGGEKHKSYSSVVDVFIEASKISS